MRHRLEGRKFGREKAHRTSLFRNLVKSMIVSPKGRIETTEAKAKSLRSYVDRLITYAKKDTVASRRLAYSVLGSRTLVKRLFEEVAPQMKDRQGGYTRVLKTGFRKGDSAPMAIIEFVQLSDHHEEKKHTDDKKAKKTKEAKKTEDVKKDKVEKKPKAEKKPVTEKIKASDLLAEPEAEPEVVEETPVEEPVEAPVEEPTETPEEVTETPKEKD